MPKPRSEEETRSDVEKLDFDRYLREHTRRENFQRISLRYVIIAVSFAIIAFFLYWLLHGFRTIWRYADVAGTHGLSIGIDAEFAIAAVVAPIASIAAIVVFLVIGAFRGFRDRDMEQHPGATAMRNAADGARDNF